MRRRCATELLALVTLAVLFLYLVPERPAYVDAGLALWVGVLIVLDGRYTRQHVWCWPPADISPGARLRKALAWSAALTLPAVAALLVAGLLLGYAEGDWPGARQRVASPHLLLSLTVYFPWALLQQGLFQFYLLGRLLHVLPVPLAVMGTALAYGLVHLPDIRVASLAAGAGLAWTWIYYRYRVLTPLALSHAVLGALFYHWVYGRDLWAEWLRLFG